MGNINENNTLKVSSSLKSSTTQRDFSEVKPRRATQPSRPTTRTSFVKIIQPIEEDCSPDSEEIEEEKEEEVKKIRTMKKIEEAKVKWRSFMKMRQSDFQS